MQSLLIPFIAALNTIARTSYCYSRKDKNDNQVIGHVCGLIGAACDNIQDPISIFFYKVIMLEMMYKILGENLMALALSVRCRVRNPQYNMWYS